MLILIGFGAGWLACALYTLRRQRLGRHTYVWLRRRLVRAGWPAADAHEGATVWFNVMCVLQRRGRHYRA